MAIKKIKVGSTEHELQTTIENVDGLQDALDAALTSANTYTDTIAEGKADKSEGAFFVEGGGTTNDTDKTSTWTGTSDRITEYYDGLTIRYKIGVVGQSTVTLNINGLGAKTVYRFNTTKLTTHFPVGSIIHLIYHSDLNGGCWVTNDYDANTNTYQRVYESSKDVEYPITTRYATTDGQTYYAEYGRYTNGVTLNPSKNSITATTFNGELSGNATSATSAIKATKDASGNVIASTYETKTDASAKLTDAIAYTDEVAATKQATITGAATTITYSNLTASRALVSNSSGKVGVSAVTSTELGYLDGVTSNVQTQLNAKANMTHLGRTTAVNVADENYTAYMARGESLNSTETDPTVNGTIAWNYE